MTHHCHLCQNLAETLDYAEAEHLASVFNATAQAIADHMQTCHCEACNVERNQTIAARAACPVCGAEVEVRLL